MGRFTSVTAPAEQQALKNLRKHFYYHLEMCHRAFRVPGATDEDVDKWKETPAGKYWVGYETGLRDALGWINRELDQ